VEEGYSEEEMELMQRERIKGRGWNVKGERGGEIERGAYIEKEEKIPRECLCESLRKEDRRR